MAKWISALFRIIASTQYSEHANAFEIYILSNLMVVTEVYGLGIIPLPRLTVFLRFEFPVFIAGSD